MQHSGLVARKVFLKKIATLPSFEIKIHVSIIHYLRYYSARQM